ncbi:putative mitochondrial protein [Andalucia godoyi]|uniref:Putative mitochondrial protein n=1 Tax=Andalucia godoyi TaxID=505711 RepID=A0A8K0AK01_ANDGO|nr:putative mitochondrial protein [Andalucia godoyi]|eukprot:ANDGO_08602.mRNA.1 putative mitochondrial protein
MREWSLRASRQFHPIIHILSRRFNFNRVEWKDRVAGYASGHPYLNAAMLFTIMYNGAIANPILSRCKSSRSVSYACSSTNPDVILASEDVQDVCQKLSMDRSLDYITVSNKLVREAMNQSVTMLKSQMPKPKILAGEYPHVMCRISKGRTLGRGRTTVWTHADLDGQIKALETLLGWDLSDYVYCDAGDNIQSVELLSLFALHSACSFNYKGKMVNALASEHSCAPTILIGDRSFFYKLIHPLSVERPAVKLDLSKLRSAFLWDDSNIPVTETLRAQWRLKSSVPLTDLYRTSETGVVDVAPYAFMKPNSELRFPIDTGLKYMNKGCLVPMHLVANAEDGLFHTDDRIDRGKLHFSPFEGHVLDSGFASEVAMTNIQSGQPAVAVALRKEHASQAGIQRLKEYVSQFVQPVDLPAFAAFSNDYVLRNRVGSIDPLFLKNEAKFAPFRWSLHAK